MIEPADFAVFQDHGYMGLYGGLRSKDIHIRKGLKKSQRILDHMGSTELAANLFRATQAEDKLRREGINEPTRRTTKWGKRYAPLLVASVARCQRICPPPTRASSSYSGLRASV